MAETENSSTIRDGFIEKMGVVAMGEGIPKIAGQIFASLVYDGLPIAFGNLADSLQVSRASVSTSVRLLEDRHLIKRVSKKGERQDYFQLAENAYAMMLRGAQARVADTRQEIEQSIADLPEQAAGIRARLSEYAGFYGALDESLGLAIVKVSKTKA
ncbi:MAG: GbsR/MarR family transcriptional regulator [Cypionkella sp.]